MASIATSLWALFNHRAKIIVEGDAEAVAAEEVTIDRIEMSTGMVATTVVFLKATINTISTEHIQPTRTTMMTTEVTGLLIGMSGTTDLRGGITEMIKSDTESMLGNGDGQPEKLKAGHLEYIEETIAERRKRRFA